MKFGEKTWEGSLETPSESQRQFDSVQSRRPVTEYFSDNLTILR